MGRRTPAARNRDSSPTRQFPIFINCLSHVILQCFLGRDFSVVFFCFVLFFDDIDVESASKYVAGKHRILTTMNSNRIVIVLCLPPPSA